MGYRKWLPVARVGAWGLREEAVEGEAGLAGRVRPGKPLFGSLDLVLSLGNREPLKISEHEDNSDLY